PISHDIIQKKNIANEYLESTSKSPVNISIRNLHTSPVTLTLVDLDLTEKPSMILKPGETLHQESFEGQKWISHDILTADVISEFPVPNHSDVWTICKYQYISTNTPREIEDENSEVSDVVSLTSSSLIPFTPSSESSHNLGLYPSVEDDQLNHLTASTSEDDAILNLPIVTLNISNFIERAVSFVSIDRDGTESNIFTIEPSISIDKESYDGQKWLSRDLTTNALLSEHTVSGNTSYWVIFEDNVPIRNNIFRERIPRAIISESEEEEEPLSRVQPPDVSKSSDPELPNYSSESFSQFPIEKSSEIKVATNEFHYYRILLQSAILHEVQKVFSQAINDTSAEISITKEKISRVIETTVNGFLPERVIASSSRNTNDRISSLPKELIKFVVDEALIQSAEITHKMSVAISETTERVSIQAQQVMRDLASDANFLSSTAQNTTSQGVFVARSHLNNVKEQLKNVVVELPREFTNFGSRFAESFAESVARPVDPYSELSISTGLGNLDKGKSTEVGGFSGPETSTVLFEAQDDSSSPSVFAETPKSPSNASSNTGASDMLFMIPIDDLESVADSYDFASVQGSDIGENTDSETEKNTEDISKNFDNHDMSPPPLPPRLYEEQEEEEFLLGASSVIDEAFAAHLPEFQENNWNLLDL
ncbi:hypothetical protein HK096_006512, partial [Nowakowskiella sp. JEL0078]